MTKKEMCKVAAVLLLMPGGLAIAAICAALVIAETLVFMICAGIYWACIGIARIFRRSDRAAAAPSAETVYPFPLRVPDTASMCHRCGLPVGVGAGACPECTKIFAEDTSFQTRWMQ